jgi:hypothetical protein
MIYTSVLFPILKIASILALFCVWTKSLICKDAVNMGSTVQSEVRRISKFPVSRPNDVSSRPDAHLSTVPSVWTSDRQASFVRTMCHPVRMPICLLFHPSGRRVFPSGRQTDKHHLSGRRVSSVRTPTSYWEASVPACSVRTFQQHVRTPISSRTVHWFFPSSRKGRSINRPDAYLHKARIAVQNKPSRHLTAVVRTLVHRIW